MPPVRLLSLLICCPFINCYLNYSNSKENIGRLLKLCGCIHEIRVARSIDGVNTKPRMNKYCLSAIIETVLQCCDLFSFAKRKTSLNIP